MDLTSAINLLSNGEFENQKPSVYAPLQALISTFCLFPLNGCWWLAGDVVHDPVDVGHLVDDAHADTVQDLVGDAGPVGGHDEDGGQVSAWAKDAVAWTIANEVFQPGQTISPQAMITVEELAACLGQVAVAC